MQGFLNIATNIITIIITKIITIIIHVTAIHFATNRDPTQPPVLYRTIFPPTTGLYLPPPTIVCKDFFLVYHLSPTIYGSIFCIFFHLTQTTPPVAHRCSHYIKITSVFPLGFSAPSLPPPSPWQRTRFAVAMTTRWGRYPVTE